MAQLVKNPPPMTETWVQSLGWEDSLEKGKATHSSILAWRISWTIQFMGSQSQIPLSNFHFLSLAEFPISERQHEPPPPYFFFEKSVS